MKTLISKFSLNFMLMLILSLSFLQLNAQSAGNNVQTNIQDKKEKIQAAKIGFISSEINLSTTEAEKFWPVYNEFQAKKEALNKPKREMEKSLRQIDPSQLTDKQASDLLDLQLKTEQSQLDLKKEYISKFKEAIGIKKTAMLFQAEKKFNDFLLRQLKERKPGPRN